MTEQCREIIRRHSRPLAPLPTGQRPLLRRVAPLNAVLFDVYGTLLISGSGEIGVNGPAADGATIVEALAAVGLRLAGPGAEASAVFFGQIADEHARARRVGVEFPEVDIIQVWRSVLAEFVARGWIAGDAGVDPAALAVEFEVRANPLWTMPNLVPTLTGLRSAGLTLGLVSNAQFYTPEAFPALVGRSLAELGFADDLLFYSYRHGQAKPGVALYRLAVQALQLRGIPPQRALYVGNDLRNDIGPAARLGFRTALFAGDARSLRLRPGDPRCAGVVPDLVVTDLRELLDCL